MNKTANDINPYAKPDGTPVYGKEPEFFSWARAWELERRKHLPEAEVKALEESEEALAKRMNS